VKELSLLDTIENVEKRKSWQFQKGNNYQSKRRINNGGRLPLVINNVRQELEAHPYRVREAFDKIHALISSENEKIALMASIDYLDRLGLRAPKESTLTVQGMIAIGTPEDYRRASLLLSIDKAQEQALLEPAVNTSPHNEYCTTQSTSTVPLDKEPPDQGSGMATPEK
jgi:hypothetical protein